LGFHCRHPYSRFSTGTHSCIQQTDLFYLSGIDQEESPLVICPDAKEEKPREILFLKKSKNSGHDVTVVSANPRFTVMASAPFPIPPQAGRLVLA